MGKHILVIDDEEAVRKSFCLALEDTGYQVDTAQSGEEGIKKAKKSEYDIIFLDLKMPEMNGVQTLREIRKIDETVSVYIVTAFHREFVDQLKSTSQEGIDFEVMGKPIGRKQIVWITKGILGDPQLY